MFVDYQIISGDIWTRALANEFMVVPAALKGSVAFKSLQVVFAALAVHFMLKITGAYGRNVLISAAFVLTLVMVGCLGYLVAYNNMEGATVAQRMQTAEPEAPKQSSIEALFAQIGEKSPQAQEPAPLQAPPTAEASVLDEFSLPLPKLSAQSLANADSWIWLAFASVIFFIVTTVCALYMQVAENNVRNYVIARDYDSRRRHYAQLHLLELASRETGPRGTIAHAPMMTEARA
jgi:hypothetical protein